MANQQHLNILKQGVEKWNRWRDEHDNILPDLSGADLSKMNLSEANLSTTDLSGSYLYVADLRKANIRRAYLVGANLNWANLTGANLYGTHLSRAELSRARLVEADLGGADLSHAIFNGADLSGANLTGSVLREAMLATSVLRQAELSMANLDMANLSGADLSGTNLVEASLHGTNFNGANLRDADLSKANMQLTIIGDVDLHQVKGLNTVKHQGPSTIGIDTIYLSQGNIPVTFLRGAGVSDSFITYARSLVSQPIDFYSCFICYSSHDQAFAERLYTDLQSKGVRCWFALEDLKIGDHYHQRIDESIRLYDKLILILSEHAEQSPWVEREVVAAREKEDREQRLVLFPLRLDNIVMNTTKAWAADIRRRWHIGDFTRWKHHDDYQQAFERLLRDLKAESSPQAP